MRTTAQLLGRPTKLRVVIADDAPDVVEALVRALGEYDDIDVVGTAVNGSDAIRVARAMRPDVVLIDMRMPVMDGIRATKRIVDDGLAHRVLVLTAYDDDSLVRAATEAGAAGYIVKGTLVSDIVSALRSIISC